MAADPREDEKPYPDFDALFRAVSTQLVRTASGALRSAPDAEDVIQTAGLNVFRNWVVVGQLETAAKQRAYFRTAVSNEVKQVWRRRRSRPEVLSADAGDWMADQENAAHLNRIDLAGIWGAIDTLPPTCARVVRLYAAGYDYGEIAEMLEISESTVRSHVSNGRRKVRADLPELPGEA